ncbi:MAG: NTP transferase domain-containing protein [Armatimonadetes bacterium]|nr:NTP transferase domain-containing protein [Armatimonadota bacterium]
MKAVVLAAGKGTRLYPATLSVAKPLLPICNRITLAYAFDRLREMGVEEAAIVVGENEPQLRAALGSGRAFGLRLEYVRQVEAKGLAHALGFAREFCGEEPFTMYLGDAVYDKSLAGHAARFLDSGAANLNLVQWVEDPRRFGVANLDGERIVKLVEKPQEPESNYAMAGLYFFRPDIWEVLPDLKPSARGEYEITDAIQMLIDRGKTVLAGKNEGHWFDTGTLDSFLETSRSITQGGHLIDAFAQVESTIGKDVVVGAGATVQSSLIEDTTVLPGASVRISGAIRHCVLSGEVQADGDLIGEIR